jgi:hypothetical protein
MPFNTYGEKARFAGFQCGGDALYRSISINHGGALRGNRYGRVCAPRVAE